MKIDELLRSTNLENSVLIGYYGGGNYGDELLLEVFENLFYQNGVRKLTIAYQNPALYETYHHDFGYVRVNTGDKKRLVVTLLRSRNIIVGGGGLWGVDMNFNVFVLSVLLFVSRWLLSKRIYLISVGYYDSTTRLGRIGAWFAGKAANYIVARDLETQRNFRPITKHVSLDADVSWYMPKINLEAYRQDQAKLSKMLAVRHKTLFITLRRFRSSVHNNYTDLVSRFIEENRDKKIIVALMEPRHVDPDGYALVRSWEQKFENLTAIDFAYNPLALYGFFQKHSTELALIGPQFHVIITAHLSSVPFPPIAYDNKVTQLLMQIGVTAIPIQALSQADLQNFADKFFGA